MVCGPYAELLSGCSWVGIPFCGGLSIVAHLVETAREVVCNDKHRLAINLYRTIADPNTRRELLNRLEATPFHEEVLKQAQALCKAIEWRVSDPIGVECAYWYFVTCWMGRSGKSGTTSEFEGGLAVRWDSGGGSSPLRFQTAVRSIQEFWGPICERCSFLCRDWTEILAKVKDDPMCGLYCDPPWVDAGEKYTCKFEPRDHVHLATVLSQFKHTKVVVRYGEDPLILKLYEYGDGWHIREITSRDQANGPMRELCITNFET